MSRDPGLQPERTQLSWNRTAYAMLLPMLLCFRGWLHDDEPYYLCAALPLLLCAVGIFSGYLCRWPVLVTFLVFLSCFLLLLCLFA